MRRAFTLIELMIVIVILGLLASLVLPNLMGKSEEAKQKLVCVQMQNIAQALKMFKLDNGSYPQTDEGLEALVTNPDKEKYPNYAPNGYFADGQLPKDPWGRSYIYLKTEKGFDLVSLGADGKEGGSGEDRDIHYAECLKR